MRDEKCDLSYWFPRLERSGVAVPETRIVTTELPLIGLCEGEAVPGADGFFDELRAACDHFGYPCFLRTGQTSDKHSWLDTCFVSDPDDLPEHVASLVEFSEMVDLLGLPYRTWVVRRFLELQASFTAFNGMPVAREYRCFFEGGNPAPICIHPYWPPHAIEGHDPSRDDWADLLREINAITPEVSHVLRGIVAKVSPQFEGRWSLDVAPAKDGTWYCIDMAEMDRSFHWPECPNAVNAATKGN